LTAADVVVCATRAQTPLFDSSLLSERVVVIAVGSHHPYAHEIDTAPCARSLVIVEDVATAMRQCGEVVQASRAGVLTPENILPVAEVVSRSGGHDIEVGPGLRDGLGRSCGRAVDRRHSLSRVCARIPVLR
jgi:ornithine cyclodeaminase/alanine dehydrogenase-like protein (mu-crystallin family)